MELNFELMSEVMMSFWETNAIPVTSFAAIQQKWKSAGESGTMNGNIENWGSHVGFPLCV